jgi:secondary thiamine-phosphate synthase enzyme
MPWFQRAIILKARARGFHLVTDEICAQLPELRELELGMAHLLLQHTSASLLLNENAASEVRADLERWSSAAVPDGAAYFRHDDEGRDDMPAHVKAALYGCALSLPIRAGALALGTWQGIWLGEHRDRAGSRTVLATLHGDGRGG